ncbi:MAG: lysophospholipid acyltransferase family protein [Gemmatimonadota bacterium]
MSWYGFFRALTWGGVRFVFHPTVEGLEHLPEDGPFLLVANHVSALDPILVQGPCRRHVHAMTKSTQFTNPAFQWALPRVLAFPARRYRVDPQAVRTALRYLSAGCVVGLYPEGERSWDGSLQPFRRGAIRLILKANVPVVPCGLSGAFEIFPRWSRRAVPHPVAVRYGPPIHFGPHPTRAAREAALEGASRRLASAISALTTPAGHAIESGEAALARLQARHRTESQVASP